MTREWRVLASPDQIASLRADPAFAEALTLGRIANLTRSCLAVGLAHGPEQGSNSERIRSSVTLLASALLAEALPVLERSARYFRDLPAYQARIRPILDDTGLRELRGEWLSPLRNKAVFHNDQIVSSGGLEMFEPEEHHALARGTTDSLLDVYYPLSDVVAISYIFSASESQLEPIAFLETMGSGVVGLAQRVVEAIDEVLGEAFARWGFQLEDTLPPAG